MELSIRVHCLLAPSLARSRVLNAVEDASSIIYNKFHPVNESPPPPPFSPLSAKIAAVQASHPAGQPPYIRIPVGESFSPSRLSRALESRELRHGIDSYACHLDVGHVPPPDCNVFLFQLLLEGCVRRVALDGEVENALV